MRRTILIAGLLCGAILLTANALIGYAYFNLATIVERNQKRILARLTDEIGRPIQVEQIQARRGWVVSLTVRGLKVADDPAFSQLPFVIANRVTIHLRFWPLLRGKAKITDVEVIGPEIRLLRGKRGNLNLDSLGTARAQTRSAMGALGMRSVAVTDGTIVYRDAGGAAPVELRHVDLQVSDLDVYKPFDLRLKLALLDDRQNAEISGRVGPLIRQRVFQAAHVPLDLKLSLSQVSFERMRALSAVAGLIPSGLSISGPLTLDGTVAGELGQPSFALHSDLTSNRVRYGAAFDKAGGVAMALALRISRTQTAARTANATLKLADLELAAGDIAFDKEGPRARLDSNPFDLAALSRAIPMAAGYGLSGKAEVHGLVRLVNGVPDADGILQLTGAGAAPPGGKMPAVSGFTAAVQFAHNRVSVPRTDFVMSGARASLELRADSIVPLKARYAFGADSLQLRQLLPARPARERLHALKIAGDAQGSFAAPTWNLNIKSSDGLVADLDYRNLDFTALYAQHRLSARPLNLSVFGGSLSANGNIVFAERPQFDFAVKVNRLNAEQLLRWGKLDAARMLRGRLTGNLQIGGRGAKWEQIKPTLSGNGRLAIADGKLAGVNIVALAINVIAAAPGVSQLISVAFLSSHRGMLLDPDTELTRASMSFELRGPRVITHDLTAQSEFYAIRGDGWFDMDSNIDMSMDLQLSFGLSVAVPVMVQGKWPSVLVLPDIPKLAERLALGVLTLPGTILKGGAEALHGLLP